jgi:hypothetical protein
VGVPSGGGLVRARLRTGVSVPSRPPQKVPQPFPGRDCAGSRALPSSTPRSTGVPRRGRTGRDRRGRHRFTSRPKLRALPLRTHHRLVTALLGPPRLPRAGDRRQQLSGPGTDISSYACPRPRRPASLRPNSRAGRAEGFFADHLVGEEPRGGLTPPTAAAQLPPAPSPALTCRHLQRPPCDPQRRVFTTASPATHNVYRPSLRYADVSPAAARIRVGHRRMSAEELGLADGGGPGAGLGCRRSAWSPDVRSAA